MKIRRKIVKEQKDKNVNDGSKEQNKKQRRRGFQNKLILILGQRNTGKVRSNQKKMQKTRIRDGNDGKILNKMVNKVNKRKKEGGGAWNGEYEAKNKINYFYLDTTMFYITYYLLVPVFHSERKLLSTYLEIRVYNILY